jgi:hypothetical protein
MAVVGVVMIAFLKKLDEREDIDVKTKKIIVVFLMFIVPLTLAFVFGLMLKEGLQ